MSRDRRLEARHVVDGLTAELDGAARQILDISASAVRLVREGDPASTASLRLRGDVPGQEIDLRATAALQRMTTHEVVYRYTPPAGPWAARLAAYDVFADLRLPALED